MEQTSVNIYENPIYFHVKKNEKREENYSYYLLIHGWTGNEFSMTVFMNAIPKNSVSVFPRGVFKIAEEQYGWVNLNKNKAPDFIDFQEPGTLLFNKTRSLIKTLNLNKDKKINLIGFSQGAALASVLAISFPDYFEKVCLLSGFLPEKPLKPINSLSNLKIFISHGLDDPIIPVEKARQTADYFTEHKASVIFCEESTGHKIGAACSINLKKFLHQ